MQKHYNYVPFDVYFKLPECIVIYLLTKIGITRHHQSLKLKWCANLGQVAFKLKQKL